MINNRGSIIADNFSEIIPSASMQISEQAEELKKKGVDIIDLSIGEPDFDAPKHVNDAAKKAITDHKTHYTAGRGIPELRKAVAKKLAFYNKINVDPEKEIIIIPGAKQAVFYAIAALINPGDEVLIPDPYWLSYPDIVKLVRGKPISVCSNEDNEFQPDISELEGSLTPKTKAIIINNPTNPTGMVWEKNYLQKLADFTIKHNLIVISDEIYEKIIFDGKSLISMASIPEMRERTITINGFSKSYAMTGYRIAYAAGSGWLIDQMYKAHQHIATSASTISQYAALAALEGPQIEADFMVEEYQKRRELLSEGIKAIPYLSLLKPSGTFYAFLNIKKLNVSSLQAAKIFLEKINIAAVPGSAYGESGEGFLRLSFATSQDNIKLAVQRMKDYFLK
ncbi:MAG: pyridoxal phosphate-dependent aminotransferase [bacterium]